MACKTQSWARRRRPLKFASLAHRPLAAAGRQGGGAGLFAAAAVGYNIFMGKDYLTRACSRCGAWHTDAEKLAGQRLSCTEVKQFWGRLKAAHERLFGHRPVVSQDAAGRWICILCQQPLAPEPEED